MTIAALFVIGRVLFGVGYVFGSVTGIPSFRSMGFAIAVILNVILISYHLGFNTFEFIDEHVAPLVKSFA